jgi:type I restriction enzyme R subunit
VATTAELLSTGVDVPSCRNIIFMKTLSSPVLFKQIIGRGSRVDYATDKLWFRIIDYTGATRLFDEWDRPPGPPPETPAGPQTAVILGTVCHSETGQLIVGASVVVLTGPNTQQGPIYTDNNGQFRFECLPQGQVTVLVTGTAFRPRQLSVNTLANEAISIRVELKPAGQPAGKIRVEGLQVSIAEEAIFMIEGSGQQLSLSQYKDYTRQKVGDAAKADNFEALLEVWVDSNRRQQFVEELHKASVFMDVLAEVLDKADADQLDLLAHLTFGTPLRTRSERATAFINRQSRYLESHAPPAREVILALLDKYRVGGINEVADARVFRLPPFLQMGQAPGVVRRFGSTDLLRRTIVEVQRRIYL